MSISPPGRHPAPPAQPELPAGVIPAAATRIMASWPALVALAGSIGIFVGASVLAGIPQLLDPAFRNGEGDPAAWSMFLSVVMLDVGIVGGVWAITGSFGRESRLDALGVRPAPLWRAVGWTVLIMFVYLVLAGLYSQLVDSPEQGIVEDLRDFSTAGKIALAFGVCVLAPLAEELLFRGFLFGGLRNSWGFWPAALLSGLLFGAAHAGGSPLEALAPLALFGFALALLYELTKSLYPSILLHAFNNCLAISVALKLQWEWPLVFAGSFACVATALVGARRMA